MQRFGPRLAGLAVAVAAACAYVPAPAVAAPGDLIQKGGALGCITDAFAVPCTDGRALDDPYAAAVSPDGRSLYVASSGSDAVAVFDRAEDGTLTQKAGAAGCISDTGAGGCTDVRALDDPGSVAVSPGGGSVYVASSMSSAVAVFDRADDGTLTQKAGGAGCISHTGAESCTAGTSLAGARWVTASPDGTSVYLAVQAGDTVAVFDRTGDGTLTQKAGADGCTSDNGALGCTNGRALESPRSVAVSPTGGSVYVASNASGAVSVFDRAGDGTLTQKGGTAGCISDTGADGCTDGNALAGAQSLTVSPDGSSLYLAAQAVDTIAVFNRAGDGTLSQKPGSAGCISDTGAGGCADGTALDNPFSVAVRPDGRSFYVASRVSDAIAVFSRAADGGLTQRAGAAGCVSDRGFLGCTFGNALDDMHSVTLSPDGRSLYGTALNSNALAVLDILPDLDGDGLDDREDRCPAQAGPAGFGGCPDSDGDGIADIDDRCPAQAGPAGLGGCPDSDGDGVVDLDDACPREDARGRDRNKDGCLDRLRLDRRVDSKLRFDILPGFGVRVRAFTVTGVPAGARVVVTCKQKRRPKRCGGQTVRSAGGPEARVAKNFRVKSLKGKRLRFGARIEVRVTARKAVGKYIRYTVIRGRAGLKRINRCTRPGQKKARTRCG